MKTVRCLHQKYTEICTIINKLKFNKTADSDNIPPELIKNSGRTLKQKLRKLIITYGIKNTFQHNGMKELHVQYTKEETD